MPKIYNVCWDAIYPYLVDEMLGVFESVLGMANPRVVLNSFGVSVGVSHDRDGSHIFSEVIDWNALSKMGLIVYLNNKIFHPQGLALARDSELGTSPYFQKVDNDVWEYDDYALEEAEVKLKQAGLFLPLNRN